MTVLSSFATSRLRVKSKCVTQRRKIAKGTRAMDDLLFGKVFVGATELEETRHDCSFFLCVLASSREIKMCHAKAQSR